MTLVKLNNRPVANSVFDEFFNHFPTQWKDSFHFPPVNVFESPNAFDIELSAAGLAKEDFNVNIQDGLVDHFFREKRRKEIGRSESDQERIQPSQFQAQF